MTISTRFPVTSFWASCGLFEAKCCYSDRFFYTHVLVGLCLSSIFSDLMKVIDYLEFFHVNFFFLLAWLFYVILVLKIFNIQSKHECCFRIIITAELMALLFIFLMPLALFSRKGDSWFKKSAESTGTWHILCRLAWDSDLNPLCGVLMLLGLGPPIILLEIGTWPDLAE